MLYLKNALGGLGRSVTDTARHAFAGADGAARWRKLALYAVMLALPGGSLAVLIYAWADRRRAQRAAARASAEAAAAAGAQPCTGGQPACRAACPAPRERSRRPALPAPRRPRGNDA
ncbi:hypothetical protein [Paraburkholderia caballeronis]|uniref:Uncharacterized protein n=1 Tax=Paraburkholderia caballeronis TaxID=416943 RepID=A0A1H7H354_9BURK|nr:hypothetical protein [Paraburkholderia caballeronis]PXW29666.1 hypothetical protein C7403_101522 [Paraburkholderia caballeronis]PXX04925.1 hypothetical protein C7407_101522 [Paraburkholderia caballeronis]RAK05986.1 hypothetical protein C7409_101522 [Paraburkholderia caballeronis]SEB45630.1 hypothetical protein SAMN05445871_0200 [Paraburkholderia caballeronis]SEK44704.1 hypothetical protein SAMN05192542_102114 [Paraburkholderia caballeronis]